MTGLFRDSNNGLPDDTSQSCGAGADIRVFGDSTGDNAIRVLSGSSRDVPLLCDKDGDYTFRAVLEEGARLHLCAFVLAGDAGNARINLSVGVDLAGPRAEFNLDGLFLASIRGHASIDVKVNHLSPDATSRQTVRGIATDHATGEFSGMVYVARDARQTDASQQNRNLCLSDTARIFTRPGLEIYADDVRCGHGTSIGRLDEEAIYYMRQRGVSEAEARRMQLEGFAAEIINHCPSEDIRNIVSARVSGL